MAPSFPSPVPVQGWGGGTWNLLLSTPVPTLQGLLAAWPPSSTSGGTCSPEEGWVGMPSGRIRASLLVAPWSAWGRRGTTFTAPLEGQGVGKKIPQRPWDRPRSGSSLSFFSSLCTNVTFPQKPSCPPEQPQTHTAHLPACSVLCRALVTTWNYLNYAFTCFLPVFPPLGD